MLVVMKKRSHQLAMNLRPVARWGGLRIGAGRTAGPRPAVRHRSREAFQGRFPCLVTWRLRSGLPSLRSAALVREVRKSFAAACERGAFRVVHFSLQRDHAHLIVEARDCVALGRGLKSIGSRLARAVQRIFHRRGPVLAERYIEGREINVSCSIGLALFPLDAMNATSLLRAADQASYHAKQFRNTWQRFSADSDVLTSEPPLAFASVQRAITERQIEVVYQPQIWAGSRTLHGVEALVRWRDPVRGLMNTSEFVRLAEDAGLIGAVTDYVVDSAMQQVLQWEREGLAHELSLAVNISGVEFASDALVTTIKRHLHTHGFRPSFLELEITESTVMYRTEEAAAIVTVIKPPDYLQAMVVMRKASRVEGARTLSVRVAKESEVPR